MPCVPVRVLTLEPGTARLAAIQAALAAASPAPRALIHDADRPLTTPAGIEALLLTRSGTESSADVARIRTLHELPELLGSPARDL